MSKAKLKKIIWAVVKYFTLILGAFISVLPVVVCVITAFKTPEEYASTNVMDMPQSWTYFTNFIEGWKQANMGTAFRNSAIILVCAGWLYFDRLDARICIKSFQIRRKRADP